jgi:hypothetical protein
MKKISNPKTTVLSILVASLLLAVPVLAQSDKTHPPDAPAPGLASDQGTINGQVAAKSQKGLTVAGQSVLVDSATALTKEGGQAIKLDDINVGDKVSVTTIKRVDGKLQAVAVIVVASNA